MLNCVDRQSNCESEPSHPLKTGSMSFDPVVTYKMRLLSLCKAAFGTIGNLKLVNMAKRLMNYAVKHPLIALIGGTSVCLSLFPFFCFAMFTVATSMFSFCGFLIIQGFLLAIGGGILSFFLLGAVIVAAWIGAMFALLLLGLKLVRKVLATGQNIVRRFRFNGYQSSYPED